MTVDLCANCGQRVRPGSAPYYYLVHVATDERRCELYAEIR